MSGGDFLSRGEGALCLKRGIEDRVKVVRDLNSVARHLGPIAAADQLGLASGDIDRIAVRKLAISPALLMALYGATGTTPVKGLVPASGVDAGVAKIMAACGARPAPLARAVAEAAAVEPVKVAAVEAAPATIEEPAGMLDAAEVRVLHATLRRAKDNLGTHGRVAAAIGMGQSTIYAFVGGSRKWTRSAADLVHAWANANPHSHGWPDPIDAVATEVSDTAATQGGTDPAPVVAGGEMPDKTPPAEDSLTDTIAAPAAAPPPPTVPPQSQCAAMVGAADRPLTPPPIIPANDDPFAVAVTTLIAARDAVATARTALLGQINDAESRASAAIAHRDALAAQDAALMKRWAALECSVADLQAAAK